MNNIIQIKCYINYMKYQLIQGYNINDINNINNMNCFNDSIPNWLTWWSTRWFVNWIIPSFLIITDMIKADWSILWSRPDTEDWYDGYGYGYGGGLFVSCCLEV